MIVIDESQPECLAVGRHQTIGKATTEESQPNLKTNISTLSIHESIESCLLLADLVKHHSSQHLSGPQTPL